jgi:hypothetical protein
MENSYDYLKNKYESMSPDELLNFGKTYDNPLFKIRDASYKDFIKKGFFTSSESMKIWIELIDIVLTKQPKLLNDDVVNYVHGFPHMICDSVTELYMKHSIESMETTGTEKICAICLSRIFEKTFIKICECEAGKNVHLFCAQKLIKNNIFDCKSCLKKYDVCETRYRSSIGINRSVDTRIYFPFSDCYPIPLMSNKYYFEQDMKTFQEKMTYAVYFLQTKRVKNLLEISTKDDIDSFIESVKKQYGYIHYHIINNTFKFSEKISMPSNLLRTNNEEAHQEIEKMITEKLQFYL